MKKPKKKQKKNDPVWVAKRKETRNARWNTAKQFLLPLLNLVLQIFRVPVRIPVTTKNKLMQTNLPNYNPATFIAETIQRLLMSSPRYFSVAKWTVIIIGGLLALLNYVIDPNTMIDLSAQAHATIETVIKYLAVVLVTLQLAVQEKPKAK